MAEEELAAASGDSQINATSDAVPEAPVVNAVEEAKAERKRLPPGQRKYRRVELPTPEQMVQDEFMNNCGTRTVLSAVMGSGLGVLFGIFMGTMETSVRNAAFAVDFKIRFEFPQLINLYFSIYFAADRRDTYRRGRKTHYPPGGARYG